MDEYFDLQPQSPVCGKVPELYRQHVLQDSARIFKESQGSVEIISWPKDANGKPCIILRSHVANSNCKQSSICLRASTPRHLSYRASRYVLV